jgi:hypothetical protein
LAVAVENSSVYPVNAASTFNACAFDDSAKILNAAETRAAAERTSVAAANATASDDAAAAIKTSSLDAVNDASASNAYTTDDGAKILNAATERSVAPSPQRTPQRQRLRRRF